MRPDERAAAILASLRERARELGREAEFEHAAAPLLAAKSEPHWRELVELIPQVDAGLLGRITRRLINRLCWQGSGQAEALLARYSGVDFASTHSLDENVPQTRRKLGTLDSLRYETFELASRTFSDERLLAMLARWIREDRASFLISALEAPDASFPRIAAALEHYGEIELEEDDLSRAMRTGLRVSLLRRFFTEQLDFINHAKPHVRVEDFNALLDHLIAEVDSHGKLGGKSAGLFLAEKVIRTAAEDEPLLREIKVPRTWYISSDGLLAFIRYNNLDDVYSRKYMSLEKIRRDYPHIVQVFKNSPFPPGLVAGLERALDDFGDVPLIVRSSSLLEDRSGSAFSGKYKSLFLANQGSREQRLEALTDAIAEVYASIFGPDPIEYRAERGLLDVHEEMGVMIQEVVGRRVGKYFFPSFSGVAFSLNEFRWSPRIRREDGLIRLVPGLGTRAVDRLGDDYPVLIAPGQSDLRVNVTPDEVARYSPSKIDLIDLEANAFVTLEVRQVLRETGLDYPGLLQIVSLYDAGHLRRPSPVRVDVDRDDLVVTFEGLRTTTPFIRQVQLLLELLSEATGEPVDLEFASDGESLFLLQCRPQSYSEQSQPASIPTDLPAEQVVFSARRFVSSGLLEGISHLVYIDGEAYAALETREQLQQVARAVGLLNARLPRRGFLLMGPGRWGSRGDIRLGVGVTYSDINNAAMLIEVARRKGDHLPDLSFGTHFFQDLVEAGIRYLPLYPDDEGAVFNEDFLLGSPSVLETIAPEMADLAPVVRVIDIEAVSGGGRLQVRMNADLDLAVALIAAPGEFEPTGPLAPAR